MIAEAIASLGLDPGISRNLSRFVDTFEKWNRSINLSAARTRDDVLEHVVDSLHVVPLLPRSGRVLDVGSGGGFPVVVAAIACPAVSFVSLEPVHKKHAFLRTAARELALANLEARAERIEDHVVRDYDAAMSRAAFDLRDWLEIGARHVKPSGRVFGFEAVERTDLGPVERHRYVIGGKPRSIVLSRRS